jgi:hypothetical protein
MTRAHSSAARGEQPRTKSSESQGLVHDGLSQCFGQGNGVDPGTSSTSIPYVAELARDVEGQASTARQSNRRSRLSGSRPTADHASSPTFSRQRVLVSMPKLSAGEDEGRAAERGCSKPKVFKPAVPALASQSRHIAIAEGYQEWASTRRVWSLVSTSAEPRPSVGPDFGRGRLSGEQSDLTSRSRSNRTVRFRSGEKWSLHSARQIWYRSG